MFSWLPSGLLPFFAPTTTMSASRHSPSAKRYLRSPTPPRVRPRRIPGKMRRLSSPRRSKSRSKRSRWTRRSSQMPVDRWRVSSSRRPSRRQRRSWPWTLSPRPPRPPARPTPSPPAQERRMEATTTLGTKKGACFCRIWDGITSFRRCSM